MAAQITVDYVGSDARFSSVSGHDWREGWAKFIQPKLKFAYETEIVMSSGPLSLTYLASCGATVTDAFSQVSPFSPE